MKKGTIRWLLVILVLVLIGAGYAYREFNRKPADLEDATPVVSTTSSKMLEEFSNDFEKANQQYLGKVVQVKGIISGVETDEKGFLTVVLKDPSSSSSVRCSMDSLHTKQTPELSVSKEVSIKGICTGYSADEFGIGADLLLNRCIVVNK
jgi:hypothetical protein